MLGEMAIWTNVELPEDDEECVRERRAMIRMVGGVSLAIGVNPFGSRPRLGAGKTKVH